MADVHTIDVPAAYKRNKSSTKRVKRNKSSTKRVPANKSSMLLAAIDCLGKRLDTLQAKLVLSDGFASAVLPFTHAIRDKDQNLIGNAVGPIEVAGFNYVTAMHVVKDRRCFFGEDSILINEVFHFPGTDLAFLKVQEERQLDAKVKVSEETVQLNSLFHIYAWRRGISCAVARINEILPDALTLSIGATLPPGFSGSGVWNSQGQLVAVVCQSIRKGSDVSWSESKPVGVSGAFQKVGQLVEDMLFLPVNTLICRIPTAATVVAALGK